MNKNKADLDYAIVQRSVKNSKIVQALIKILKSNQIVE